MARGKHGTSSAARRAIGERDQQIESYQYHIKRLNAEVEDLKKKLADQDSVHRDTVNRLKAQRDEGLSPEMLALRREMERGRERAAKAESESGQILKYWRETMGNLISHFQTVHGLKRLDAVEEAFALTPEGAEFWIPFRESVRYVSPDSLLDTVEWRIMKKVGVDGLRAIDRARGRRS